MWLTLVASAMAFGGKGCGGEGDPGDWLVAGCATHSALTSSIGTTTSNYTMSNGIVRMELQHNVADGLIATTSITMLAEAGGHAEKLSSPAPLGALVINDVNVVVGGPAPSSVRDARPRGRFIPPARLVGGRPVAGGFHFVPGSRGSNPNTSWPPRGIRVEFDVAISCEAVAAGSVGTFSPLHLARAALRCSCTSCTSVRSYAPCCILII